MAKIKNESLNFLTKSTSQKGFTLIELLIVLGILVILTALTLASLTRSQEQQVFSNNFDQVYSMINSARSLAIAGKGQFDYVDYDNDGCKNTGSVPLGATCTVPDYVTPLNYGVYFNNTSGGARNITVFADMNLPNAGATGHKQQYDIGTDYALGADLDLNNLVIPSGIALEIQDDSSVAALPAGSAGAIFFSPNYADMNVFGLNPNPYLLIRLKDKTNVNICKQIRIHKFAGIAEVESCSVPY